MTHRCLFLFGWVVLGALSTTDASAQAWLPPKGEGAVSVLYQNLFTRDHFLAGGGRVDRGHIQSNNLLFDVTYGLTDKIALTLAAPFIRTRYTGASPHPRPEDQLGEVEQRVSEPAVRAPLQHRRQPDDHHHAVCRNQRAQPQLRVLRARRARHASARARGRLLCRADARSGAAASLRTGPVRLQLRGTNREHSPRPQQSRRRDRLCDQRRRSGCLPSAPGRRHTAASTRPTPAGGRWIPSSPPITIAWHASRCSISAAACVSVTRSLDLSVRGEPVCLRNSHSLTRGLTVGASWSFGGGMPPLVASAGPYAEPKQVLARCLCQK